jgi:hypothetical protein
MHFVTIFGHKFMAVTVVRRALLALLLVLFCSQNVVLASVFEGPASTATAYERVATHHDAHYLVSLLAEGSEEKQERDDSLVPLERDELYPRDFELLEACKVAAYCTRTVYARNIPFYTLHHKLII